MLIFLSEDSDIVESFIKHASTETKLIKKDISDSVGCIEQYTMSFETQNSLFEEILTQMVVNHKFEIGDFN
jgi:hypothetical protein